MRQSDKTWDDKMRWCNEQLRRRIGNGAPHQLLTGQLLDYVEVLTLPYGMGKA